MKRLIVGIDPGTTVGIALLSFSGEVIDVISKRGMGQKEIERYILSHGRPVMVATDVAKPPERVERIARQVGAVLFSPRTDISEKRKDEIMRILGYRLDDHGRDALAAAYTAYITLKPKIEQIRRRLTSEEFVEEIIERVVRGEQMVRTVEEEIAPREKGEDRKRERNRDPKEVLNLRRRISELLRERDRLMREIEKRRNFTISRGEIISRLEEEITRIKRDRDEKGRILVEMEKEIDSLKAEIEDLKGRLKRISEGLSKGLIVGPPDKVVGEEIYPGIVLGEPAESEEDRIRRIIEEYRSERRKHLKLL